MRLATLRLACLWLLLPLSLLAKGLDTRITLRTNETDLDVLLRVICDRSGLDLVLGPGIKGKKASLSVKDMPVGNLLRYLAGLHRVGIASSPDGRIVLAAEKDIVDGLDLGESRVVRLSWADADKFADLLNKLYKGKLTALADPHTNSVILVPGK